MTESARPDRDDDALAAEYALGVLPHDERVALARRLATDAGLRERVRVWDEYFAGLSDEIGPVSPPAHIRTVIERKLFTQLEEQAKWWNSLGFWRGLSIASLVGLVLVTGLYLNGVRPSGEAPPNYVAELSGQSSDVRLMAFYDGRAGIMKVHRTAGIAAQGRSFELWLIAGNDAPVSLGVLPASPTASMKIPDALKGRLLAATLAISDEPEGGSLTGLPTGAVLATGKVAAI